MDASDAPPAHGRPTALDLQILNLLREDAKSAGRLAEVLTHEGERVDPEAVRLRLRALARRGLVVVGSPANPRADAGVGGSARADLWEITEEGRALAESQAGVARPPLRARRRRRGRARRRVLGARGHSDTHGGVRRTRGLRRPASWGRLGRCGAFEDPVQAKFRESTFSENR